MAAKPPLVVARASNPSEANRTAEPTSHALGMSRGVPGTCNERNRAAGSSEEVGGVMDAP